MCCLFCFSPQFPTHASLMDAQPWFTIQATSLSHCQMNRTLHCVYIRWQMADQCCLAAHGWEWKWCILMLHALASEKHRGHQSYPKYPSSNFALRNTSLSREARNHHGHDCEQMPMIYASILRYDLYIFSHVQGPDILDTADDMELPWTNSTCHWNQIWKGNGNEPY